MVKKGDTFKIGEICQESGVYRLKDCSCMIRGKCDISKEQYTIPLVKGKKFPPCRNCSGSSIKWEFVKKA
jgi:hypothetical protein